MESVLHKKNTSQTALTSIQQELEYLKNSSTILKSFVDNTIYGMAIITPDFHLVESNSRMRNWFPDIDNEACTYCYEQLYWKGSSFCPDCPASECLSTGTKSSSIMTITDPNGDQSCYKVTCSPLSGPDTAVWGVLEIVEDITENFKKDQDLKALEAQYAQLIENASDAIMTFTPSGTILQFNKRAQQLFGYPASEITGRQIFHLMPEALREKQQQQMNDLITNQRDQTTRRIFEGTGLKHDGTCFAIEATFSFPKPSSTETITAIIRDISKRKIQEHELKSYTLDLEQEVATSKRQLAHSEERYRTLVETANDAIISTDKAGTITYCNTKAEQIFGYQNNELPGKSIASIVHDDVWQTMQHDLLGSSGITPDKMVESCGITKNGELFPVEFTLSIYESDGQYNLTVIGRDITRRKNLEQELQQYTARLEEKVRERTFELTASQQNLKSKLSELSILQEISESLASTMDLEAVLNIILVGVTSHHGLGFNRAFLFLLNEDESCLEGKVAIGPSDGAEAQKIWGEILGKKLSLKEILQTYMNKAGQIDTHVNSVIKDIKIPIADNDDLMVQALTQGRTCNITDAFNHPNVPRSLLTTMNCNAFALVPLSSKGNLLGVLWADNAITKNPIEERDIDRLSDFSVNASLAIEKSNLYKNIQEKVGALDLANRELKENRDRLIRSEKLAAVGQMSATVAHGIRNPLVSIGGFARRLLKKEAANSTSRKYLQIIVEEIDRLETILSELLDFVRPRKLTVLQEHPHEVIDHTLEVVFYELEKRNIRIEKHFTDDIPVIDLDAGQIKRVLHNLFKNAMDAMPGGGTIRIVTSQDETNVKISISDTGIGIAENDVEKVFHPFFTSKETGSGLGLAVCNQIISIHGGHIKLRRQIPQGVVFDIYLPVHPVA